MKEKKVSIIALYDKERNILLQDRKSISKSGEDFGFFGGEIESGETPKEALVREIKEELDYDLKDSEFEYIGITQYYFKDKDLTVTLYLFATILEDKIDKFEVLEGAGIKKFTLNEARKSIKLPGCDYKILDLIENYFEDRNI